MEFQRVPQAIEPAQLERRGRVWLVLSFLACPCHLPLTLAILAVVLGGTAAGALVRDHAVLAGVLITSVWVLGTGRGLWLIRQADRGGGACPSPTADT
jgi:cytochrome c biogenesis protein CcdA